MDEFLQEPVVEPPSDHGDDQVQESVFLDAMAAAGPTISAIGEGIGYAQLRQSRQDALIRAQLAAEAAELRRALELERCARIVAQFGLGGLTPTTCTASTKASPDSGSTTSRSTSLTPTGSTSSDYRRDNINSAK